MGKLIAAGMRVAVCEQVEDPKQAKGLVRREVTQVVSPGTVTAETMLDPRECNFLAAIAPSVNGDENAPVGLAWLELSTGRFIAAGFSGRELFDQLARVAPAECLLADEADPLPGVFDERMMVTRRPIWAFSHDSARESLSKQFGTASLDGFGFEENDADVQAIRAAGAILDYLSETQKSSLDHLDRIVPYRTSGTLEIDESSRRSLELTRTIREGRREGSLLGVLDRTVTAMGSRMMSDWLSNPLTDIERIRARHDAVEELLGDTIRTDALRDALRRVYDVERLLARVATGRATPRDLSFLGRTLAGLPKVKERLEGLQSPLLTGLD